MYLHEATNKTAAQLVNRMTEVEKCILRNANNPDRIEYLRQVHFSTDNISPAVMAEVKMKVDADFASHANDTGFPSTWQL